MLFTIYKLVDERSDKKWFQPTKKYLLFVSGWKWNTNRLFPKHQKKFTYSNHLSL